MRHQDAKREREARFIDGFEFAAEEIESASEKRGAKDRRAQRLAQKKARKAMRDWE